MEVGGRGGGVGENESGVILRKYVNSKGTAANELSDEKSKLRLEKPTCSHRPLWQGPSLR